MASPHSLSCSEQLNHGVFRRVDSFLKIRQASSPTELFDWRGNLNEQVRAGLFYFVDHRLRRRFSLHGLPRKVAHFNDYSRKNRAKFVLLITSILAENL